MPIGLSVHHHGALHQVRQTTHWHGAGAHPNLISERRSKQARRELLAQWHNAGNLFSLLLVDRLLGINIEYRYRYRYRCRGIDVDIDKYSKHSALVAAFCGCGSAAV
jgi:hypothetical protein